jgi:medium-chain acyl-[acyl-carrier-protein] hydrolase
MTQDRNEKHIFPLLWKDRYTVRSCDADTEKRLTLMSLCNYFQESAWRHAERCDFGYKSLAEKGQFWVLSRLHIEISDLPVWQQPFTIETWSKGTRGVFALRDFLVEDELKSVMVRATSGWLILDAERRRPRRLTSFEKTMPFLSERHASTDHLDKIEQPEKPKKKGEITVQYCDLDLNRHTNSSRYIEWILNGVSECGYRSEKIVSFSVNYLAESVYGDRIELLFGRRMAAGGSAVRISLLREHDKREILRACIRTVSDPGPRAV